MENSTEQPANLLEERRFLGCLMGLAVGDALGAQVEFMPPGTFTPVTEMVGGGPHKLEPGQWTDDTSMALCLAESLLEKGFDPADQMRRYSMWFNDGYMGSNGRCFDWGAATAEALMKFKQTGDPYCGSTAADRAGNGSLMRLAPVAMAFARNPAEAIDRAADSSRTTHGAAEAVDACRYFAGLLVGALRGDRKNELLKTFYSPLPWSGDICQLPPGPSRLKGHLSITDDWGMGELAPSIKEVARGSFARKAPPTIDGSGHVVKCLEAALWAFHASSSFKEGCLLAVNLGNDADTTGAVYGQLAGAFYGLDAIPKRWQEKIAMRETILDFAQRLYLHGKIDTPISRTLI